VTRSSSVAWLGAADVAILDKFHALVNDLSSGLPAELAARRKQYDYYRDRLLTFEDTGA
jgi:type I restriction enzyme S subunit